MTITCFVCGKWLHKFSFLFTKACMIVFFYCCFIIGAVRPDVLHFASLWITLTVPEGVGTENWAISNLPFLLNPSSIARMQS